MVENKRKSQLVIYKTLSGETKIDVRFDGDTVWLTQNALAELFQTTKNNISLHVKNIFEESELTQKSTVKKFLTVQKEGVRDVSRDLEYYNWDLIFATEQARRRIPMTMRDWIDKLHGFLTINDRNILQDAGKISHELMQEIADKKFVAYKKIEAAKDTDFDEVALKALEAAKNK